MSKIVWMMAVVLVSGSMAAAAPVAVDPPACDASKDGASACCADSASTALDAKNNYDTWSPSLLRNTKDPLDGKATEPAYSMPYVDEHAGVTARIYFSTAENLTAAESKDGKVLYTTAYLAHDDGTSAAYGKPRLSLKNNVCPVSGVGANADRILDFDPVMATNCTAGSCAIGDGFKVNYNAIEINTCCPSCIKMLVADPARFLANIQAEIDTAFGIDEET